MPDINWEEVKIWSNQIRTSFNSLVWTFAKARDIDPEEARQDIVERAKAWKAPSLELAAVVALLSLTQINLPLDAEPWLIKLKEIRFAAQSRIIQWGLRRD